RDRTSQRADMSAHRGNPPLEAALVAADGRLLSSHRAHLAVQRRDLAAQAALLAADRRDLSLQTAHRPAQARELPRRVEARERTVAPLLRRGIESPFRASALPDNPLTGYPRSRLETLDLGAAAGL